MGRSRVMQWRATWSAAASSWLLEGSVVLASVSFWSTLFTQMQAEKPPVEAEPGPSHVSPRRVFRRIFFPRFLDRAVRNWKYGALFPHGLVSGSHVSSVWVLHVEYRIGFFGDAAILWAQCLAPVDT